jgi:hypothetical protein
MIRQQARKRAVVRQRRARAIVRQRLQHRRYLRERAPRSVLLCL